MKHAVIILALSLCLTAHAQRISDLLQTNNIAGTNLIAVMVTPKATNGTRAISIANLLSNRTIYGNTRVTNTTPPMAGQVLTAVDSTGLLTWGDPTSPTNGASATQVTNIVNSRLASSTNALASGFTNFPTGKTIYADINGVDATAQRGDLAKPFGTLSNALEAAQSGDTLIIRAGVYAVTDYGFHTNAPLRIVGKTNLTIRGEPGTILSNVGLGSTMLIMNVTNVVIRDITFRGVRTNGVMSDASAAVALDGYCKGVTFSGVQVLNYPNQGIGHFKRAANSYLDDFAAIGCSFINIGGTNGVVGNAPDGTAVYLGDLNTRIIGNTFSGNLKDIETYTSSSISENRNKNTVIQGNVSRECIQHFYADFNTNTENLSISCNAISSSGTNLLNSGGTYFILLAGGHNVEISGNSMFGPAPTSIGVNGVQATGSAYDLHSVNINGNSFYGLHSAVTMYRAPGSAGKISGVNVVGNTIMSNSAEGMVIAGNNVNIAGNAFIDIGRTAFSPAMYIGIAGTTDASTNVQIRNNLIGHTSTGTNYSGIWIATNVYNVHHSGTLYAGGGQAITNGSATGYGVSAAAGQVWTAVDANGVGTWSNPSGGSGALQTNANQFGANLVLNIKTGARMTNFNGFGDGTNAGRLYPQGLTTTLSGITDTDFNGGKPLVTDGAARIVESVVVTSALFENFFRMGISNIVASAGIAIGTNAGALYFTNTGVAGSGNFQSGSYILTNFQLIGITNILAATGIAIGTNNGALYVTNTSTSGGGTNFPPVISNGGGQAASTNITVGLGVRQSIYIATNASFKLVFTGTPNNGEALKVTVSNLNTTANIIVTNSVKFTAAGSNITTWPVIASNSFSVFNLFAATNANLGVMEWILESVNGKEMDLGVAGAGSGNFLAMGTNFNSLTVVVSNTYIPQASSINLSNWATITTNDMANIPSVTFLTNWANAVSNLTTSVTNSASVTNWINSRQSASAVLTNLVGTVANNVTNVVSLSTTNATSKPLTNSYTAGVVTLFGLEAGANTTITPNGSNLVIASTGGSGSVVTNSTQFGATADGTLTLKSGLQITNAQHDGQALFTGTNQPGYSNYIAGLMLTISNSFKAPTNTAQEVGIKFVGNAFMTGTGGTNVFPVMEEVWKPLIQAGSSGAAGHMVWQSRTNESGAPFTNMTLKSDGTLAAATTIQVGSTFMQGTLLSSAGSIKGATFLTINNAGTLWSGKDQSWTLGGQGSASATAGDFSSLFFGGISQSNGLMRYAASSTGNSNGTMELRSGNTNVWLNFGAENIGTRMTNWTADATSFVGFTNTTAYNQIWNVRGTSGNIVFWNRTGLAGATAAGVAIWTNTVIATGSDIVVGVNCGIAIDTGVSVVGGGRAF